MSSPKQNKKRQRKDDVESATATNDDDKWAKKKTTTGALDEDPSNNANDSIAPSFAHIEEMTATEYLARVSQQAKRMPTVFVSCRNDADDAATATAARRKAKSNKCLATPQPISFSSSPTTDFAPIDGSAASISYLYSGRCSLVSAPSPRHVPSQQEVFAKAVLSHFERLRGYLERCQEQGIGGKVTNRLPVPPMKCRESWHEFCVGATTSVADDYKQEGQGKGLANAPTSSKHGSGKGDSQTNNDEPAEKNGQSSMTDRPAAVQVLLWKANLPRGGFDPTVRLLLQMDQVMIRRVLSHMAFFVDICHQTNIVINNNSNNERVMEWIYALLARLQKPVHRDDAAVLFGLLRDLSVARSKIDCKNERQRATLGQLNVLMVLIGVYFEQAGGLSAVMAVGCCTSYECFSDNPLF